MKSNNKQTYIIIILLVILTALITGMVVYFWQQQEISRIRVSNQLQEENQLDSTAQMPEGSEPEDYIEDDFTVADNPETPVASPTTSLSDEEMIKDAFAAKYSRPASEVNLTVSKNTGTHASGGVSFAGEMGGGMWFAYKKGTDWIIAFDGNGTPLCENIIPNNFPSDMIGECWDEAQNKLIKL